MRLLIWHWGRFGAGPRYAAWLAQTLDGQAGFRTMLSLARDAEILAGADAPGCDLAVKTYRGLPGLLVRLAMAPFWVFRLRRRIRALRPDAVLCAMPSMLDLAMIAALCGSRARIAVVVHDAAPHPGERVPMQHVLQRALIRRADVLITLSRHVAKLLRTQGLAENKTVIVTRLPPLHYGRAGSPRPRSRDTAPRLLFFGRLLPYKGLDLLCDAWYKLGADPGMTLHIAGQGPDTAMLAQLRTLPGVTIDRRWIAEHEVAALIAGADALVLPYREASQSGAAAVAAAAGLWVLGTRVGGLSEQLHGMPRSLLRAPDADDLANGLVALRDAIIGGGVHETVTAPFAADPDFAGTLRDGLNPLRHAGVQSAS